MEKECRKCKARKPLSAFNRHRANADGHQAYCKQCVNLYRQGRGYRSQKPTAEKKRLYKARYEARFPLKNWAHEIFSDAVAKGKVQKAPCVVCGDKRSQGHHEDYSKPLEVIWLCQTHHKQIHLGK